MAELTLVEAVNDAFHVELERDPDVMVMGEDVGRAGGVFRATAGLRDRFGPDRCVDTPLAEAGILGAAVGLCMAGWRPVCEMQYDAFSYPCLDQLITHVGRYRWRTGGTMEFPLVVRMPYGGGAEDSAGPADVLAHHHHVGIALELDVERVVHRLDERQLSQGSSAARPGRARTTPADRRTCARRGARCPAPVRPPQRRFRRA